VGLSSRYGASQRAVFRRSPRAGQLVGRAVVPGERCLHAVRRSLTRAMRPSPNRSSLVPFFGRGSSPRSARHGESPSRDAPGAGGPGGRFAARAMVRCHIRVRHLWQIVRGLHLETCAPSHNARSCCIC
jgi:hypothetical protein